MATNLEFKLTIEPIGYDDNWPEFYLKIDDEFQDHGTLYDLQSYNFNIDLDNGEHSLIVGFTNKTDNDTIVENNKIIKDKAILIHPITIEGYTLKEFMYNARYYPINRESMDSEYLSWNGEWRLPFTTPIFTWIHKVQSLGWIYGTRI